MRKIKDTLLIIALLAAVGIPSLPAKAQAEIIITFQGQVNFLRVHDVGTGFGPPNDMLDAEVIFSVSSTPNQFFGFQLRNNENGAAHQAMFDLLRDAFLNDLPVAFDAVIEPGKTNAPVIRIWVSR